MSCFSDRIFRLGMCLAAAALVAAAAPAADAGAGVRPTPGSRGPARLSGFDAAFESWNRYYKASLVATGTGNVEGASQRMAYCREAWYKLLADYAEEPPAQFADDPQWAKAMATTTGYLHIAEWRLQAGDLERAHEALEPVRYLWRDIRQRNDVLWFGDQLLRYHDVMEPVVAWGTGAARGGVTPENVEEYAQEVQRLAGALLNLRNFPARPSGPERRTEALISREWDAIESLADAVAARDYDAIPAAAQEIKKWYIPLYMALG